MTLLSLVCGTLFVQVVAPSNEEETTSTQKREERLRKFRELHFKRVTTNSQFTSHQWNP